MRTSLFVPALFAVALAGSSALAEKSHRRIPDRIRSRGDVVDKSYRGARHDVVKASSSRPSRPAARHMNHAASRVRCSDVGVDCAARRSSVRAAAAEVSAASGERNARMPAFMAKILGSDRTSFNEAGEDQGMGTRAAKRAWSKAAASGGASHEIDAHGAERKASVGVPAAGSRMSCNEAGECMMSSKAAKKEWAYQAVRAGTWRGPEAKSKTPAERAIEEGKKAKSDADKH